MDKPALYAGEFLVNIIKNPIHHMVADVGPGGIGKRRRVSGVLYGLHDRLYRKIGEVSGLAVLKDGEIDGLVALVVRDFKIVDVYRCTLGRRAEPAACLPDCNHNIRFFLGHFAPSPLVDYMAGPCRVLPTSGTARFFSPLSTDTFLKKTSIIEYTRDALQGYAQDIIALAESEHLDAHANSIAVRFAEEAQDEKG